MKKFEGMATKNSKYSGTIQKKVYVESNEEIFAKSALQSRNKDFVISDLVEVENFDFNGRATEVQVAEII